MSARTGTRRPRLPGWWTLTRDIGSFLGGWAVIFSEVQRAEIRESVLLFAGAVIGVPGMAVGFTSVVEALERRRDGTGGSSPSQVESADLPLS